VVNRRFKETYSLHFKVPLPLTLKMEAAIYSEKDGIYLQENNLSNTTTFSTVKAELLCRSR
jgi:hypothetical protein